MGLYHHGKIPVPTDYSDSVNLTCYVLITNYMQLQGCSTIAGSYMCQKNYQTLCRCCDKLMDIKQRKRISNRPDNCDQQDWERWEPPFSSSSRDYQTSWKMAQAKLSKRAARSWQNKEWRTEKLLGCGWRADWVQQRTLRKECRDPVIPTSLGFGGKTSLWSQK